MKNSYIVIGIIVLIALGAFIFSSRKTEAPVEKMTGGVPENIVMATGDYKLDTESSSIKWKGEYLAGLSEEGTVGFSSGSVKVENNTLIGGEFIIDMNSIESIPHKDRLVEHLKSDDFFGVVKYPTSKFVIKSFTPSSDEGAKVGRYTISGNLSVRGIEKPISFMATVLPSVDGGLTATGSFAINRADWEVKYNSASFFSDLGDKIIRDAVEIKLDLKAQKVIQ